MHASIKPRTIVRVLITLVIAAAAAVIGLSLWHHYMYDPWTRDGRIDADVVEIAPDVSGLVTEVDVHDNQLIHRGDLLLRIDNSRYRDALTRATAEVALAKVTAAQRQRELERRSQLSGAVISSEDLEIARARMLAADAQLSQARAALSTARINLERTQLRAPTDGYITHLNVFTGDYAVTGHPMLALIDSHSFRVDGYFEETKLRQIHVGDPVSLRLLDGGPTLQGQVQSIARGITDHDAGNGGNLLANVNPTFSWVRLAQRVPVRIHIDKIPTGVTLVSGMTCTVTVHPRKQKSSGAGDSSRPAR